MIYGDDVCIKIASISLCEGGVSVITSLSGRSRERNEFGGGGGIVGLLGSESGGGGIVGLRGSESGGGGIVGLLGAETGSEKQTERCLR